MSTFNKLTEGFQMLSNLTRQQRAWVANRLHNSMSPAVAASASKTLKVITPRKRPKSVFLSHNSKDKPFVRALYRKLSHAGLQAWLDEAELNAGDSLVEALSEALFQVDCVVAVVSRNSVRSNWVKKELSWAMTREIKGKRVRVIPIIVDDVSIPKVLSDKLWLDFSTPYKRRKNSDILISDIKSQTNR